MTKKIEYGQNEKKKIECTTVELKPIDIVDITKEDFKKYEKVEVFNYKELGPCVIRSSFVQLFDIDKNRLADTIKRKLNDAVSVHVSHDEAIRIGIRINGNPNLGVRLFSEAACMIVASLVKPELQREFMIFIKCVFHRDEVRAHLFPVEKKHEESSIVIPETQPAKQEVSVNIDMKGLLESFELSNQLMLEQVEASKKIASKMDCMGKAVVMLSEYIAQLVNQNAELINYIGTLQKDNTKEIPKIEIPERFKELERSHANGNTIKLNLKRGDKMPVYKKRFDEMQTYRNEITANIPREVQNSVLSHAYTRMRDVYGVPLDTYKNEYFADTGKSAKSTLEIAHWLEFRNPVINGLLRCCVETVFPECSNVATTH